MNDTISPIVTDMNSLKSIISYESENTAWFLYNGGFIGDRERSYLLDNVIMSNAKERIMAQHYGRAYDPVFSRTITLLLERGHRVSHFLAKLAYYEDAELVL